MDLETALQDYCERLTELAKRDYCDHFKNLEAPKFSFMRGAKWFRIVKTDGPGRCVHSFIRIADGVQFKAHGWKQPSKTRIGEQWAMTLHL